MDAASNIQTLRHPDKHGQIIDVDDLLRIDLGDIQDNAVHIRIRLAEVDPAG
jgi:hypothetical protein